MNAIIADSRDSRRFVAVAAYDGDGPLCIATRDGLLNVGYEVGVAFFGKTVDRVVADEIPDLLS